MRAISVLGVLVLGSALAAAGCSSPSSGAGPAGHGPGVLSPPALPSPAAAPAPDPWLDRAPPVMPAGATADARRWIPGDLHMHLAPFDAGEGAPLTVVDLARRGLAAGLEFVIATPHLGLRTLGDPARRRRWMASWTAMAAQARATRGFTIIPGAEYTLYGYGHFGVSGVDLAALPGRELLAEARTAGGFVVVNHPYALPTRIPGIPISEYDLSFRPWTEPSGTDVVPHLDGVEVWNLPLGLANLARRPGGQTGELRAFAAADRLARAERRRVATVGGSDSHRDAMVATTWVLATEATEQAILAALRMGATCVGTIDGGTLIARGDADPADRWARIGDVVAAADAVELRWTGRARLFVDGVDRGEHDGGFVHRGAAGAHTYRIELGSSRCGFIYANLAA